MGGFHEVIELCQEGNLEIAGIIDNNFTGEYLGFPIIGKDIDAPKLFEYFTKVPVVITPDQPEKRKKLKVYYSFGIMNINNQEYSTLSAKVINKGYQQLPGTLKRRFLAGLKVIVPLAIIAFILTWIFSTIDNVLQPIIIHFFGHTIPGVGFGITILVVLIIGIIVATTAGRRLITYIESLVTKLPILRQLYNGIKQFLDSFSPQDKGRFLRVVLVEFPKKGTRTIGFVTNEAVDQSGRPLLNVFIPTAPNPTSGFLQIMTQEGVIPTDISVDDALKMIISAGRLSAYGIVDKLSQNPTVSPELPDIQSKKQIQTADKTGRYIFR